MNVTEHYDMLVDEGNDPYRDPAPLREYMDKWDGAPFIAAMELSKDMTVLEIGVGTGRLAAKVAPLCRTLHGIDISPKTVSRATENLVNFKNAELICGDFSGYAFAHQYDVIYCSLTLMHFEDKKTFIKKVTDLLRPSGRFVLSMDKNQSEYIDCGTRKVRIYPDDPAIITELAKTTGLTVSDLFETEFATILVCTK